MEDGGNNKRRVGGGSEEREQPRIAHSDSGASAPKKVFTRETPKWLPHATVNKHNKPRKENHGPGNRFGHGADRIQTISDSQRRFAAQFSVSAAERRVEGASADAHTPGGGRWASKTDRPPKAPGGSPPGSRWAVKSHAHESFGGHAPVSRITGAGAFNRVQAGQGNFGSTRPEIHEEDRSRSNGHPGEIRVDQGCAHVGVAAGRGAGGRMSVRGGGRGDGGRGAVRGRVGGRGDGAPHRAKSSTGNTAATGLVKGPWTKEEDQKIIDCITQNITKWSEIAERVEGRVGKQCRERWFNHLDPSLTKSIWTPAEDEILVRGQARFGNSWTKIAKLLPGRSENAVKNRWNSAARKKGKADPRSGMADLAKMSAGMVGNGGATSDFMGYQQVSMLPERVPMLPERVPMLAERGTGGQMQNAMMPSFQATRHMKSQSATPTAWPVPFSELHGHMRPMSHGGMPVSMLQTHSVDHRRPDHHPPVREARAPSTEALSEQGYGLLARDQQVYTQPLASAVPMTQRTSLAVENHGRVPTAGPDGLFNTGDRAVAGVVGKRELGAALLHPTPDQQSLGEAKGDTFFPPEDELSLSTTLFSLSLSKTSLGGFAGSFGRGEDGRQESDAMGGSFCRQGIMEPRAGRSVPRGLAGCEYGAGLGGGGTSYNDRGLERQLTGVGLLQDQQLQTPLDEAYARPRVDCTTSVSELLFSPAQVRTGDYPP